MRVLRVKLSDTKSLEFKLPNFSNKSRLQIFLAVIQRIGFWLLMFGIGLMPFVYQLAFNPNEELPYAFLVWVILLLVAMVSGVILAGWKFLTDPPGLIQVLVFSLLSVAAYLFAPISGGVEAVYVGANTFGAIGVEYLAGLFVMGFVGVFYFIQLFTNTERKLDKLTSAVVVAMALVVLITALDPVSASYMLHLLIPAVFVLAAHLLFGRGERLALLSAPGLVIGLLMLTQQSFGLGEMLLILLSLLVMLVIWLRLNSWQLNSPVNEVRVMVRKYLNNSDLGMFESAKDVAGSVLIFTTIAWFLVVVAWILTNSSMISAEIEQLVAPYQNLNLLVDEWPAWLVGNGATFVSQGSTLATVIAYQGLVGVVAYLVLIGSSILITLQATRKEFARPESFGLESMILVPVIIFTPLAMLVADVSFGLMFFWWVAFGILAARLTIPRDLTSDLLSQLKFGRLSIQRRLPWIQLAAIIALVVFIIYLLPLLRIQIIG